MLKRLIRRYLATPDFNARQWSNAELERFAPAFRGEVVNISAGADGDKQGRRYRDYFTACSCYAVSNYGALSGLENEFALDLEAADLPVPLVGRYDVVFSHTVLEHVYDVHTAVRNLCAISRDAVLTVVPFLQSFHHDQWYSDYWRFSPMAVKRLFQSQGLSTVYLSWNEDPLGNLYVFHICSRHPDRWSEIARQQPMYACGPGVSRSNVIFGEGGLEQAGIDIKEPG